MPEKVVEVDSLVKQYPDVVAVDGITFDIYRGEIFSLVGPNAAGKTTTVEILECLKKPSTGSAKVLGFEVVGGEKEIKQRIGVMPQDFNAFERLSVRENVELIAKIYDKGEIKQSLEALDLWKIRRKKFFTLSGGMKRRVGICMAVVSDPELLFLDEPTTGLDPQGRRECWEVIRTLKELGKTIFLTTHYMEEAEKLSDRVGVIVKGKIVAIDRVSALLSKYGEGTKVVVKGDNKAEALLKRFTKDVYRDKENRIIGKFPSRAEAGKIIGALYELGDKYTIEIIEPTIEEVFLRLAGGMIDERGELI